MSGAMVSFVAMAACGRELANRLDRFEIITYRSLIGSVLVCCVLYFSSSLTYIKINKLQLHLFRNIFHFFSRKFWPFAVKLVLFCNYFFPSSQRQFA